MEFNNILENIAGNSPFIGFLIWYILSERKTKLEDKEYNRKVNDKRNENMTELLLKNHDVIRSNQAIMESLSNKYDDLRDVVTQGFTRTHTEINSLNKEFREVIKHENSRG